MLAAPLLELGIGKVENECVVGLKLPMSLVLDSMNQSELAGPDVMLTGPLLVTGIGNSAIVCVDGLICPSRLALFSVNQRLPSGPVVIQMAPLLGVGIGNSWIVPASSRRASKHSTSNRRVLAGRTAVWPAIARPRRSAFHRFTGSSLQYERAEVEADRSARPHYRRNRQGELICLVSLGGMGPSRSGVRNTMPIRVDSEVEERGRSCDSCPTQPQMSSKGREDGRLSSG